MLPRLAELATLFLKLGTIGFGGPTVHIAMLEEEVVTRRGWMTRQHFLDLVGATNLIPGPNSTEMTIHVGFHRAGVAGLAVAGLCFILPAVLITTAMAWGYKQYGTLPSVEPLLSGIKPAVLVVIVAALGRLGRKAIRSWQLAVIALAVAALTVLKIDEVAALLIGSLVGMFWLRWPTRSTPPDKSAGLLAGAAAATAAKSSFAASTFAATLGGAMLVGAVGAAAAPVTLFRLGLFFLKIGAVLYGSGYVLLAYLQGGIEPGGTLEGVLTEKQLLDAIAIGQFTPGPILSTATFIGYLIADLPGAAVATLGIFLPSFFFVAALNPLVPRMRRSAWTAAFLDAVNAASIGLFGLVTVTLAAGSLVDWRAGLIAIAAAVAAFRYQVRPAWLVLGGGAAGWLLSLVE